MQKYGEIISTLRKEKGLTQKELGNLLNVTYQAVSKWEKDLCQPDIGTLQNMMTIFEITLNDFVKMAEGSTKIEIINKKTENTLPPKNMGPTTNVDAPKVEHKENFKNLSGEHFTQKITAIIMGVVGALTLIVGLLIFLIPVPLAQSQIYNNVKESIFYIDTNNNNRGTGFFIDANGTGVVDYSLIESAKFARITMHNGNTLAVTHVVGVDESKTFAIIKVNAVRVRPISFGDSGSAYTGDIIYSMGYGRNHSLGESSTIFKGKITTPNYTAEGKRFIRTNLTYESVNSCWVLINEFGRAIGVSLDGNNMLNLGAYTPIEEINYINRNINLPLETYYNMRAYHTLSYISMGETIHSETLYYGSVPEFITPSLTGYSFDGWYTNETFTTEFNFSEGIKCQTNVYAKWIPNTYAIKFESSEGSGTMQDIVLNYGETKTLPACEYVYPHHTFTHWSYNGEVFGNEQSILNLTSQNGEVITLTANWILTNYEITYKTTNPHAIINSESLAVNSYTYETPTFSLEEPVAPHYEFIGWTTKDILTPTKEFTIPKGSSGSIELTANWSPKEYSITYTLNGGTLSGVYPTAYTYENGLDSFPEPVNGGYTFLGWHLNGKKIEKIEPLSMGENLTLNARWQENIHTLTIKDLTGATIKTITAKSSQFPLNHTLEVLDNYYYGDYNLYKNAECTELFAEANGVKKILIPNPPNFALYANAHPATDGLEYAADGSYLMVSGYKGTSAEVYIPSYHNKKEVRGLATSVMAGNTQITDVCIPNTIQSISSRAFANCTNLKNINLSNSVWYINQEAFENCAIQTINIPSSVKSIHNAFVECSNLKTITIPASVESVWIGAFENCTSLTEVNLNEGLKKIYYDAFKNCCNLEKINIPESVKEIGENAFAGTKIYQEESNWENGGLYIDGCLIAINKNLTTFNVKEGTRLIANNTFSYSQITSAEIPTSVTKLPSGLFIGCKKLINYAIPKHITIISDMMFAFCDNLKQLIIHAGVTQIGFGLLSDVKSVSIMFEGTKAEFEQIEIDEFENTALNNAPKYYLSNDYIEGQNSWAWASDEIAIWQSQTEIVISGTTFTYSENQPTQSGNFWYKDTSNNICIWE